MRKLITIVFMFMGLYGISQPYNLNNNNIIINGDSIYSNYMGKFSTSILSGRRIGLQPQAAYTGLEIDATTPAHTGSTVIKIKTDVNSASIDNVYSDMIVATRLDGGETIRGYYTTITGNGSDNITSNLYGFYGECTKGSSPNHVGFKLAGSWDRGISLNTATIGTDITLSNGATIHNTDANTLTITEATTNINVNLTSSGTIKSGTGIGYSTGVGAGGTVTQLLSKSTAVTIDNICGRITMNNATLASGTSVTFLVNCSPCAANDVPVVVIKGNATLEAYYINVCSVVNGQFNITLTNYNHADLSEAIIINYVIIKSALN